MNAQKELLDAIEIVVDRKLTNVAQIYTGLCSAIKGNGVVDMIVNNKTVQAQYYGITPTVNQFYKVFVPSGNMSNAFIITGGKDE